jgi:hypothetical protein
MLSQACDADNLFVKIVRGEIPARKCTGMTRPSGSWPSCRARTAIRSSSRRSGRVNPGHHSLRAFRSDRKDPAHCHSGAGGHEG